MARRVAGEPRTHVVVGTMRIGDQVQRDVTMTLDAAGPTEVIERRCSGHGRRATRVASRIGH